MACASTCPAHAFGTCGWHMRCHEPLVKKMARCRAASAMNKEMRSIPAISSQHPCDIKVLPPTRNSGDDDRSDHLLCSTQRFYNTTPTANTARHMSAHATESNHMPRKRGACWNRTALTHKHCCRT